MLRCLRVVFRGLPCLAVMFGLVHARPASAQIGSARYASLVMDAGTGQILSAANADEPRYPASLTKMMTIYMLFEALRDRRVSLDEYVPVSPHAASMSPSKLGLVPGTAITVEQALLGLVTKSANDAAAALGELLGGDEDRFAQMMTLRARALGMSRTTFRNASGWPDPDQVTTARDLALLARHLIQDYPQEYRYFSVPSFVFHGRVIPNHDRMLQTYPGADGLKTGYIDASGCNLVTSAVRGDVRMIGVVMGAANGFERDSHMASLLDAGFDRMGVPIYRPEPMRVRSPSLIAAASAATLPPASLPPVWHSRSSRPTVRLATARSLVASHTAGRGAARRAESVRAVPEARKAHSNGGAPSQVLTRPASHTHATGAAGKSRRTRG